MAKNFTPLSNIFSLINKSGKESEPIGVTKEKIEIKETVEYEPEDAETKKYVFFRPETIKLPPDLKKVGLQPVPASRFSYYQTVRLPLADDKILPALHQPITSSLRWLATLAFYILKKAHLTLRVVGGKTIRIFKKN